MPQAFGGMRITNASQIANGIIVNAHIDAAAAIAKTKLAALAIVNADIDAGAAIAKTKLAALAIVNADIDAGAAIVDSKLAAITTASKVSGAALTLLANIPAGAGAVPGANIGALLGDWTLRDSGTEASPTIFQAATDLLIVVGFSSTVNGQYKIYTDVNTPPTTLVSQGVSTDGANLGPSVVPVKKNDYYKIVKMNKVGAGNNFYTVAIGG